MIVEDAAKVARALGITAAQITRLEQMDSAMKNAWGRPPICRACGKSATTRCYVVEWWTQLPIYKTSASVSRLRRRMHKAFACAKCVGGAAE